VVQPWSGPSCHHCIFDVCGSSEDDSAKILKRKKLSSFKLQEMHYQKLVKINRAYEAQTLRTYSTLSIWKQFTYKINSEFQSTTRNQHDLI
jgi:hypothetical protein